MSTIADVALFLGGLVLVVAVVDAAVRTFVLPRPSGVRLSRLVMGIVRAVFDLAALPMRSYEGKDRVMALYGPITLMAMAGAWLVGVMVGFAMMDVAVGDVGWRQAFRISGSSLLTLGFAVPSGPVSVLLVFAEAAIGLLLVALLIAYLPTIYNAFSRREVRVTRLAVRAGTPPTPLQWYARAYRTRFMDQLDEQWRDWEQWFVELEETHTSLAILNFFRSPNPHRSWLTTSGAVLDAAAVRLAVIDREYLPDAGVCIRSGYLALRAIADFFRVAYDPDPAPGDAISVTRDEFLELYRALEEAGVPVKADAEQCWRDFRGWRVNYDAVLVALAGLVVAPYAPWISDRGGAGHQGPLRGGQAGPDSTIR